MGFGTIFATVSFLFIFASMILVAASFQRNITLAAQAEHERDALASKNADADIIISDLAYAASASAPWVEDRYAVFSLGTFTDTAATSNGVHLNATPYSTGTFESQIIDTAYSGTEFDTITWTSIEPALTTVQFQLRAENSTSALLSAPYIGPDGTAGTFFTVSGSSLDLSLDNNQYIQYIIYFDSSNPVATPEVHSVNLGITRPVGHVFVNVTNTGTEKLIPEHTDLYVSGVRILRNDTERTITLQDASGEALWEPGENLSIVIFTNVGASTPVLVSNGAAKDGGII